MAEQEQDESGTDGEDLETLLREIKAVRGVDLTGYKRTTLRRRVVRRMNAVGVEGDFDRYRELMRDQPQELSALFDSLFINVTSFFRDTEAWDFLASDILPHLLSARPAEATVRIWSAGCATGEEPFSIAMLLADKLGLEAFGKRVKIYATDWDEAALRQARRARYPTELEAVPDRFREAYFEIEDGHAVLHHVLRRAVIFGQHDLLVDAPISRVDLLLCRNTLMYFNAEAQDRILSRLHFALAPGGILFLGRAEMLLSHADSFAPIDLKHRIFRKQPGDGVRGEVRSFTPQPGRRRDEDIARAARLREAALEASPVAQIVLDPHHRVAVINYRATQMFQIGPPDFGRPLQDLELSYRPVDLRTMLDEAVLERRSVQRKNVEFRPAGREIQFLDVSVTPAFRDGTLAAITLTFADVTHHQNLQVSLQRFSENLETAYEELQSANEELETTNEELQSANEELETTNEELQAANEEMETVNEELRSTNEELEVTNDQLRRREIEVRQSNVYLNSILSSLRVAAVVVGEDLEVQVWNQLATELWGLRPDEVVGKSFAVLDIGLPVDQLVGPIQETLAASRDDRHETREIIVNAVNRRGRDLVCRVRLTPLTAAPGIGHGIGRGVCILMEQAESREDAEEAGR